jgi:hypothetical protein
MPDSRTPELDRIAAGRDNLTTVEAAIILNRRPQTLRKWASEQSGPIRPSRVNGRLAWPVVEIRKACEAA